MARKIFIIQGHPDPAGGHFGHALADAYAAAARTGGHEVRRVAVAQLDFPLLRTAEEWDAGPVPEALRPVQADIAWADHVVLIFPLWLGTMPALVKAFLEQVMRPGFAFHYRGGGLPRKGLTGKSARLVVTMGMPAFWYRWFFRAHGVRGLARNVLKFCGFNPVRETLIGFVGEPGGAARRRGLARLEACGRAGT
jgi:putative NADPH-quinone reductase